MNTKFAAIWCLMAYLSGCAYTGASSHTVLRTDLPAAEPAGNQASPPGARLVQRADELAGRLRATAAQVPDVLDSVGDSDFVRCMVPVIAFAGLITAIVLGGGGSIGCLDLSAPAVSSSFR